MIKAVLFDIFGVIYPDTFWSIVNKHVHDADDRHDEFSDLLKRSNMGEISREDLWNMTAEACGIEREQLDKDLRAFRGADKRLMEYIADLRQRGLKTGIISNVGSGFIDQIFKDFPTREYFDQIILSSEVKITKPNPQIYSLAAERLKVAPEECVFVDDREWYVKGAQGAGMQGIVFVNTGRLKADLDQLLADSNN